MKKIIKYLLVGIFTFTFWNCVSATTYKTNELIPADSLATVETESFTYQNFIYYSSVNANKKSTINFESIKNKSEGKLPISINLLLFDESKKNIGYLTYCTNKDYDTDWAKYELAKGASVPFSISVSKKYFADETDVYSVKYIAVQDENPYCKIGGYSKYEGLTLEQITNGEVSTKKDSSLEMDDFFKLYGNISLVVIIIAFVIVFVVYLVIGAILNALYKRMYAKTTALAYLPITNNYVSVKLAFGNIVAVGYLIALVLSWVLIFVGVGFLTGLVNLVSSISFIVVIVKLITKKYDLFYFEPSIRNVNYNNNLGQNTAVVNNNTLNQGNVVNNNSNNNLNQVNVVNNNVSSMMTTPINGGEVVDLSYSNVDDAGDISDELMGNNYGNVPTDPLVSINSDGVSSGVGGGPLSSSQVDSLFGESSEGSDSGVTGTTPSNNNQEESDLSKFFR